ncbi:leucine-rich repeat-containing G-protein coupled receptor 4-like [Argopecten irradians]|uniref:leucine-rich repeat-containing G-protein coupled receptor 4-like n=1 Tax=Argopecten irradians TaxID=31199 RepID=UPI003720271E
MLSSFQVMLTIPTQSSSASALNDPQPCPVKAPCSCDSSTITCSNLIQREFPTFTKVKATWYCWTLVMNYNYNITIIPAGAFDNVPLCSLYIDHNSFAVMQDGALKGSEPYLHSVFMRFNKFKEVPNEIARMPNITMLSIHDNPITTLPEKMAFAPTLEFLDIGSPEMTTWPYSIQTLKKVWSLSVFKFPMPDLPMNAFEGLENVVLSVTFQSTHLKVIPKALNRLRNMTELTISDNIELTSEGITDDAFSAMGTLKNIYISNTSLTRVPNLSNNTILTQLSLANSPISRWDASTLPDQSLLQSVDLSFTNFDHIPAVLKNVKSLTQLRLEHSKVLQIESSDLEGLQKLSYIYLSYSPLENISMDAFKDTHILQVLYLDYTKLSGLPRAIERLPAPRFVGLQNISIECSCAELGWMKNWIGLKQAPDFGGECHNNDMYLVDYIQNEIPKCP